MRYINEICQGCGKVIQSDDDIVVCPECGTPQHRECYNAEHKCVNEHLHSDEYEWKPKHQEEMAEPTETVNFEAKKEENQNNEKKVCPLCNYENDGDATVCENCGQPFELFGKSIFPENGDSNPEMKSGNNNYSYGSPFEPESFDEGPETQYYYSPNALDGEKFKAAGGEEFNYNGYIMREEIDGIKNRDLVLYLRTNAVKYYEKFCRIQNGKLSFNWASFVFAPYWFFYRKLHKLGAVFMALTVLLSAFIYPTFAEYMDIVNNSELAEILQMTSDELEDMSDEEFAKYDEELVELSEKVMDLLPNMIIYSVSLILLHIIAGFIADKSYKNKTVADIRRIAPIAENSEKPQQQKYVEYVKSGGTSMAFALLSYGVMYVISMLLTQIIMSGIV